MTVTTCQLRCANERHCPRPRPRLRTRARARGFTMIELLLVCATITIVAAMAVPRYGQALSNYRVRLPVARHGHRSEEHTSELQSQSNLVCRLLLEKKKIKKSLEKFIIHIYPHICLLTQ